VEAFVNPATRVGRYLLFQGGNVRRLSLLAWALFALGLKRMVKTP
jgi:hypothetical protein